MNDRDDILAERIADLVAERLGASRLPEIVTAQQLADYLGVSRETVYANADQLGAIRLGDGDRPRLRFPLDEHTVRSWQRHAPAPQVPRLAPTRRAPSRPAAGHDLLPIRGRKAA